MSPFHRSKPAIGTRARFCPASTLRYWRWIFGPEPLPYLIARDELAGALEKNREDLEGLLLEVKANPVLAELG